MYISVEKPARFVGVGRLVSVSLRNWLCASCVARIRSALSTIYCACLRRLSLYCVVYGEYIVEGCIGTLRAWGRIRRWPRGNREQDGRFPRREEDEDDADADADADAARVRPGAVVCTIIPRRGSLGTVYPGSPSRTRAYIPGMYSSILSSPLQCSLARSCSPTRFSPGLYRLVYQLTLFSMPRVYTNWHMQYVRIAWNTPSFHCTRCSRQQYSTPGYHENFPTPGGYNTYICVSDIPRECAQESSDILLSIDYGS